MTKLLHQPIFVTKPSLPPKEEFKQEIDNIWESCWLTNMGPEHIKLESNLRDYLKIENVSLFANGHLALETALQSFNFKSGSEVITTPFTFASTSYAITHSGLIPVFCDVKDDDCTIDETKIESLITEKTVAIVPVHVYGYLCNTEEIERIANKHNLLVIYDGAHSFGVKRKKDNRSSATFGDITMYSFHATKVYNTFEGGALTYHENSYYDKFKEMKDFGINNSRNLSFGYNAKMTEDHAAMGICNLHHLSEYIEKRKKWADIYDERLSNCKGLHIIKPPKTIIPNYGYYPVRIDEEEFGCSRDEFVERLKEYNIFPRKYFYPLTSQLPAYNGRYNINDTPTAAKLSEEVVTLPLYSELGKDDTNYICDSIIKIKDTLQSVSKKKQLAFL